MLLITNHKVVLCFNKWANKLHNANSARPSGFVKCFHRSEFSVLITSQLKIQIDVRMKSNAKADQLQSARCSKRALSEESTIYIAIIFQVLQTCNTCWFAVKFYVTDHPPNTMSYGYSSHKFRAFKITSQSPSCTDGFAYLHYFRKKGLTNSHQLLAICQQLLLKRKCEVIATAGKL